uniref:Uncharacterized protein n=1 Tax=Siphoviridae sp. ctr8v12 TaxID=2825685 RepID=A0A8S5QFE8_9CAUD|nr:MAG TPA: hypothetical protein [Siphoviridae sp. ctr8v12]
MKQEDIEKAAVDSCVFENSIFNPALTPYYQQGFKDGADWRINSVWHDAKDVPQPFRAFVILHDTENDFMMLTQHSITCDSDYNVIYQENDNMIAWAYIKDLTPNTEE